MGWILDKPLSLLFDPFESIVLFLSVLIVNYTCVAAPLAAPTRKLITYTCCTYRTQDGLSNWLEGFLLMMVYLIIAVSFWFYVSTSSLPVALDARTQIRSFAALWHHCRGGPIHLLGSACSISARLTPRRSSSRIGSCSRSLATSSHFRGPQICPPFVIDYHRAPSFSLDHFALFSSVSP